MNNEEDIRHCLTKNIVLINNMERNHKVLFSEIIKIIDYMSPDEYTGKFRKSIKRRDVMVKICNDLMAKVRQGLTVFEEDVASVEQNVNELTYWINQIDKPTEYNINAWLKIMKSVTENTEELLNFNHANTSPSNLDHPSTEP